jgi:prevent-host-death family protein
MVEVGVRELKNNLSAYLRRVRDGEAVRVTSHGKAIADLVPADDTETELARLIAAGRVTPASKPHSKRAPRPVKLGYSLSERLIAEREEEDR